MRRKLGGRGGSVLEKCFGRLTGKGPELGDQVWLVGEAARERELAPAHRSGEAARVLKAQQPPDGLRREAELLAEARDEPFPAPAELLERLRDTHLSVRVAQPL